MPASLRSESGSPYGLTLSRGEHAAWSDREAGPLSRRREGVQSLRTYPQKTALLNRRDSTKLLGPRCWAGGEMDTALAVESGVRDGLLALLELAFPLKLFIFQKQVPFLAPIVEPPGLIALAPSFSLQLEHLEF